MLRGDFMEDIYIQEKFEKWLKNPIKDEYGDHGSISENIQSSCIDMIKKAFFDGCKTGYGFKLENNYQELMQK